MHPSDKFLLVRKHIFSSFRLHGLKSALNIVDNYRKNNDIDDKHYKGIRAELGFFSSYKKDFGLFESLDSGNHADFIGNIKGSTYGIDVTTNLDFKDLETYTENQKDGYKYLIALVNPETLKMEEIFNINFPFCADCGGRMIDILYLEPSGSDKDGLINYSYNQRVVTVCSFNVEHSMSKRESNFMTADFSSYINEYVYNLNFGESSTPLDIAKEIDRYAISNLKFFRKELNSNLMACGSPEYIVTNPRDGEGYNGTKIYFRRPFIKNDIGDLYDFDFRDLE